MAEWLKAADCKSARASVHRFESYPVHHSFCKALQFLYFSVFSANGGRKLLQKLLQKYPKPGCYLMKKVAGYKHLSQRGKGGRFYFRRYVPEYARHVFDGLPQVAISLNTNDIAEARYLLVDQETIFEAKLKRAKLVMSSDPVFRAKHIPSPREMEAQVRIHFAERRMRSKTNHYFELGRSEEAKQQIENLEAFGSDSQRQASVVADGSTLTAEWAAETIIEQCNWDIKINSGAFRRLLSLIDRSQAEASRLELTELKGHPTGVPDEAFSEAMFAADAKQQKQIQDAKPVQLIDIFDAYVTERKPRPRTARSWKRHLDKFVAFVGKSDAKQISQTDVLKWKDHLSGDRGLSAATINDAYLAALKTTLNWAVDNAILEHNVATKARVRSQPKSITRERGLSDEEALLILRATMDNPPSGLSRERAFARRWVPWLCAFSGARVNEITQMRAQDISLTNGIWTMLITPEAGGVKSNKSRIVPLHPQIFGQGFVEELAGKSGPLFYDPKRRLKTSTENTQAMKTGEHIAKWVRNVGVTDRRVQPNHGWRHRFKTVARRVKMDPEIRDVIQGHRHRTEGEAYGDTEIEVLYEAIYLLQCYQVENTD